MFNVLFAIVLSSVNYTVDSSEAPMISWRETETTYSGDIPGLLKSPVIITVGDINDDAAEEFSRAMQAAIDSKEPVIPILIDSYGGSVYALLRMADTLKAARVPIATICVGKCMSAGAMLLALGTEGLRFSAPNATILLHDVSSMTTGKISDMKTDLAETERLNKLIFSMIAKNVGKPDDYFLNIIEKKGHVDWFLTPEEAKKHNLVNQLRLPRIKIKVKTQMILE